jgi:hypothetical protein
MNVGDALNRLKLGGKAGCRGLDSRNWQVLARNRRGIILHPPRPFLPRKVMVMKCISSALTGAIFIFGMFETAGHFAAP